MLLGLTFGLFVAFTVLYLFSFLRNGAILRGGAVAAVSGEPRGGVVSAEAAPRAVTPPASAASTRTQLSLHTGSGAVATAQTQLDGPTLEEAAAAAATAASPHSQSSAVFMKARSAAQGRQRATSVSSSASGRRSSAAAVGAADSGGVSAAWDPKQLAADDYIRLIFLFTFALPVFAFVGWQVRGVRMSALLRLYCWCAATTVEAQSETVQRAVKVLPVFLVMSVSFAAFLYYALFIYLDHRDKDVSLKRHNTTWSNRCINWFKFRVYRRFVNLECYLWKRYFSLQLIPAYGPLPLFLYPEHESGGGAVMDEAAAAATAAATSTSARHNPFYVAVSSSSAGDVSPPELTLRLPDSPLGSAPFSPLPAIRRRRSTSGRAAVGETGVDGTAQPTRAGTAPVLVESPLVVAARAGSGGSGDDWDEEERSLLRSRRSSSSTTTAPPRRPASSVGDSAGRAAEEAAAVLAGHTQDDGCRDACPSAELTAELSTPPPSAAPPPPMRRAHYFFAAHPHGILPWCCCVNLISNVTQRNRKLFVDNRDTAVLLQQNGGGVAEAPQETHAAAAAARDVSSAACAVGTETRNGAAAAGADQPSPRPRNAFTTTNTRAVSSPCGGAPAAAYPPLHPGGATQCGGVLPIAPSPREGSPVSATPSGPPPYAKARYYTYQPLLKKFVLRLDKDEAVPASPADAAVYQQRLAAEQQARAVREAGNDGGRGNTGSTNKAGRGQRLKIRIRAVVATFPFYVPLMREVYMFNGYMDASYETCKRVLLYNNSTRREREALSGRSRCRGDAAHSAARAASVESETNSTGTSGSTSSGGGGVPTDFADQEESDEDDGDGGGGQRSLPDDLNHLLLFPGGASEALLSSHCGPAKVLLRRRKGFLRLALHTQSGLVPVYTFGETDYFEQYSTATTRYAAPLDDDSTLFSQGEAAAAAVPADGGGNGHDDGQVGEGGGRGGAGGVDAAAAGSTTGEEQPGQHTAARSTEVHTAGAAGNGDAHHHHPPASACGPRSEGSRSASTASTPQSPPQCAVASGSTTAHMAPKPAVTPHNRDTQQRRSRLKDRERQLLQDEAAALDREGRLPHSPSQATPGAADRFPRPHSPPLPPAHTRAALGGAPRDASPPGGTQGSDGARSSPRPGRLPRLIQAFQRWFQETFGISLPIVRNIIPHRVTGATVVGRPIYFELPPELQRMYTDPANHYDREVERAVLLAAQEVYFNELQELFFRYAPRFLKDPARRKLEIL